jgi:hypothetical protein
VVGFRTAGIPAGSFELVANSGTTSATSSHSFATTNRTTRFGTIGIPAGSFEIAGDS